MMKKYRKGLQWFLCSFLIFFSMGALTIKSYSFESRVWELFKLPVLNILSSYPAMLLMSIKYGFVTRIFPWGRNDFISNSLRFSFSFYNKSVFLKTSRNIFSCFISQLYLINFVLIYLFYSYCFVFSFVLVCDFCLIFDCFLFDMLLLKTHPFDILTKFNISWVFNGFFGSFVDFDNCLQDDLNYFLISREKQLLFSDLISVIVKAQSYYSDLEIAVSADEAILGLSDLPPVPSKELRFLFLNLFCKNNVIDNLFYLYFLKFKFMGFCDFFFFFYLSYLLTFTYGNRVRSYFPFMHENRVCFFSVDCLLSSIINSLGFLVYDVAVNPNKNTKNYNEFLSR